jgi:hypothetical protein
MCCLCIQFTHENTSERTILHQVNKKNSGGGEGANPTRPPLSRFGCLHCKSYFHVTWTDMIKLIISVIFKYLTPLITINYQAQAGA